MEQKATQVTERAVDQAQSFFENTKSRIAHQFTGAARAIESAAQRLDQEQQTGWSRRVQGFARTADDFSRQLQHKSPRELKSDLERFARERPAWFLGVAFVTGLLAARFLKSSDSDTVMTGGGRRSVQYAGA
jgi:hypothetical protein